MLLIDGNDERYADFRAATAEGLLKPELAGVLKKYIDKEETNYVLKALKDHPNFGDDKKLMVN